ncbi:MAG TPA: nuclear transport factor 2 family protein [Pseudomonadales bacterium]|nr:nuclear transport factor 2 family protein [Pseudomonadales bacterium]
MRIRAVANSFTGFFIAAVLAVPVSGATPASKALAPAAQDLLAEVEIARLATTYGWAVDAKDIDTLMTIFSEDAEYDLSAYAQPPAKGKVAIRNVFLHGVFPSEKCSFSSISNVRVQISGDQASGGDYFIHYGYNPQRSVGNTRTQVEGQHFYRFVKEDGAWKIAWMQGHPVFEASAPIEGSQLRDAACRAD